MRRRVFCLVVIVSVLFQSAASAAPDPQAVPQGRRSSTGKRVVWTLIGAGLGFGAGLVFGLRQFDDAIDSDRKVWTSALVGAGAGGVAGALLSGRGAGNNPALGPSPPTGLDNQRITTAAFTMEQSATATTRLAERVRSFNATSFNLDRGASVEEPGSPAIPGSLRHAGPAVIGAPPTDLMSVIPRSTTLRSADARHVQGTSPRGDSLTNGMVAGAIVGGVVGLVIVPATECKPINPECPRLLRIGVGIPSVAGGAAIGALLDKLFE